MIYFVNNLRKVKICLKKYKKDLRILKSEFNVVEGTRLCKIDKSIFHHK